jgi:hypothetical protein
VRAESGSSQFRVIEKLPALHSIRGQVSKPAATPARFENQAHGRDRSRGTANVRPRRKVRRHHVLGFARGKIVT